ncbi:RCC1 domain-containing protein [Kitasatospora sp. NPDC057692]|uniref:RCC1 domain-containing protein n=1 Tax=Kitasatospora sp. NPDC057692 TaxID=3346215 RepID=UPI003690D57A
MADKRLKAWGNNRAGQLGDGSWAALHTRATTVLGLTGVDVVRTAAGGAGPATGHGLALLGDGSVRSWGANASGQLGDGSLSGRGAPDWVVNLGDATEIAAGGTHSLALCEDGTVLAWGQNTYGQLGNGGTADSSVPARVRRLDEVIAIAAGLNHSLALRADGTVWAWGHNANGQLGDGTSTVRSAPVRVAGLDAVTRIAAGAHHSLAVAGGYAVKAWGLNASGQLGDNTTINRYTPVRSRGGWSGGVAWIAAGSHHSLAVTGGDHRLSSWGQNTSGQLGDGTTTFRVTPVAVPGLTGVRQVAGGREHTVVLLAGGEVHSWGANGSGQLGDGGTIDSSAPVRTFTDLVAADTIAAPVGGDFSLAD